MWHRVKIVEPGMSLNTSLMGTTYAALACEALRYLIGVGGGAEEQLV